MSISAVFNRKTLAWVGFFVMTSIIWRGPAFADMGKIAPDLLPVIAGQSANATGFMSAAATGGKHRLIIQTNGKPGAGVLQQVGVLGGRVNKSFSNINSFVAEVPAARILTLSDNPSVTRISPDRPVGACFDYGVESVGGDTASTSAYAADGTGLAIALIDSGVAAHPDIPSAQIAAWKDFVNGKSTYYDDCGHGTHLAGLLIGNGKSSTGAGYTKTFKGIAPKAKLVVAKVLGADGSGYVSDVISAIDWVISIANAQHVRVISLSLGHPVVESYTTDPLCQAVERAVANNLVVVCSAGNAGPQYGTINSPGNDPQVIAVGAVRTQENALRSDDEIFYYSSRGPSRIDYVAKPDIVAPGNNIISLRAKGSYLDTNYPDNRVATTSYSVSPAAGEPQYFVMSGTSAAAPMVAAAATLVIQKAPKLTPNAVKAILMYSASKMSAPDPLLGLTQSKAYDAMTIGSGYLNVEGALAVMKNIDTGKAVGTYWARSAMAGSNLISSEVVPWSKTITWNNFELTGDYLLYNDYNWYDVGWGGSNTWVGSVNYGVDLVDATKSTWQPNWAPNPAENPDAQLWGDNAIWGGRTYF